MTHYCLLLYLALQIVICNWFLLLLLFIFNPCFILILFVGYWGICINQSDHSLPTQLSVDASHDCHLLSSILTMLSLTSSGMSRPESVFSSSVRWTETSLSMFHIVIWECSRAPCSSAKARTSGIRCSCGSAVEHCVSSTKGCGFNSQGTRILTEKKCIAWMHCKSFWIKASAKCINVKKLIWSMSQISLFDWWEIVHNLQKCPKM